MKTLREYKNRNGYNLEIYEGNTLIEWRFGLTYAGRTKYRKHWDEWQSFTNPN